MKLIDQETFGRHIDGRLFSVVTDRGALDSEDAAGTLDALENIFAILVKENGLTDERTRHFLDKLARCYDEAGKLSFAATAQFFALQGLLQSNQGNPKAEVAEGALDMIFGMLDKIAKIAERSIELQCGFVDAVDVYIDARHRILDMAIKRLDDLLIVENAGKLVTFCEAYAPERHIDLAHGLADQSTAFLNLGDHEASAVAAKRAIATLSNSTSGHDELRALSLANLGTARLAQGNVQEAEPALRSATALAESLLGPADERTRSLHRKLAEAAVKSEQTAVAKAVGRMMPDRTQESFSIQVFLSSTFVDMTEERKFIVEKTLPELSRRCRELGLELHEIDLRWGITADEIQTGALVELCLAAIEKSSLFLAVLGHCYGTTIDAFAPHLIARWPWLQQCHGKSITEIEIEDGALRGDCAAKRSRVYSKSQRDGFSDPAIVRLVDRLEQSGTAVREYDDAEHLGRLIHADVWNLIGLREEARQPVQNELALPVIVTREWGSGSISRSGLAHDSTYLPARMQQLAIQRWDEPTLCSGDLMQALRQAKEQGSARIAIYCDDPGERAAMLARLFRGGSLEAEFGCVIAHLCSRARCRRTSTWLSIT
jgi:tetratricopeptide (TPR) repeat protein